MIQVEKLIFANQPKAKEGFTPQKDGQKSFGAVFNSFREKDSTAKEVTKGSMEGQAVTAEKKDPPLRLMGSTNDSVKELAVKLEEALPEEIIEEDLQVTSNLLAILNLLQQLQDNEVISQEEVNQIQVVLMEDSNSKSQLQDLLLLLEDKISSIEEEIVALPQSATEDEFKVMAEGKALLADLKEQIHKLEAEATLTTDNKPEMKELAFNQIQRINTEKTVDEREAVTPQREGEEAVYPVAKDIKVNLQSKEKDSNSFMEANLQQQEDINPSELNHVNANREIFNDKIIAAVNQQQHQQMDPQSIMDQVVSKVELLVLDQKSEMKLQLTPENLGTLTIKLTVEDGVLTGKVLTGNPQVKELIENNLNQLKINLGEKGITVSSLEVSVDQNNQQFNNSRAFFQQKQSFKKSNIISPLEKATYLEGTAASSNPYLVTSSFEGTV